MEVNSKHDRCLKCFVLQCCIVNLVNYAGDGGPRKQGLPNLCPSLRENELALMGTVGLFEKIELNS